MGLGKRLEVNCRGEQAQKLNGYANVADFGAVPGMERRYPAAFEAAALKTGYSLFVLPGNTVSRAPSPLTGRD